MIFKSYKQLLLASLILCLAFNLLYGSTIYSIQLVGNFSGITCNPEDSENDMTPSGPHEWVKLKFIDEPGAPPDTINFKFTKNRSYYPEHWGWSFEYGWGIAELAQTTSNIAAVLPDSGFYYFNFNDSTYEYSLERPSGEICGSLLAKELDVTPEGAIVTLLDGEGRIIGNFDKFTGSQYSFNNLPHDVYSIYASAPGCNDTTVTNINLPASDSLHINLTLYKNTAAAISCASYERKENEIVLSWSTSNACAGTGFNIYRGKNSTYSNMDKRNIRPICGNGEYYFIDTCEDNYSDYYYYIVEADKINGVKYGPVKARRLMPYSENVLGQNYPNPFNPSTTVPYTIGGTVSASQVTISFFDVSGKMISRKELGKKPAGNYTFTWNPSETGNGDIPSGVYYCRLTIGKNSYSRKIILLR